MQGRQRSPTYDILAVAIDPLKMNVRFDAVSTVIHSLLDSETARRKYVNKHQVLRSTLELDAGVARTQDSRSAHIDVAHEGLSRNAADLLTFSKCVDSVDSVMFTRTQQHRVVTHHALARSGWRGYSTRIQYTSRPTIVSAKDRAWLRPDSSENLHTWFIDQYAFTSSRHAYYW